MTFAFSSVFILLLWLPSRKNNNIVLLVDALLLVQTAVRGGKLTILSAGREDEGEYICTATAARTRGQARAQVYVR